MILSFPPNDLDTTKDHPYLSDDKERSNRLTGNLPIVSYLVTLLCCIVHLLAFLKSGGEHEQFIHFQIKYGAMKVIDPYNEPIWKYLSTNFIHDSSSHLHLIFNIIIFLYFAPLVERALGRSRFILFIIISAFITASIATSIEGATVGISGVIYAIFGFMWAAWRHWPSFLHRLTRTCIILFLAWIVIGIFLPSSVSSTTHISGIIFGITLGVWVSQPAQHKSKWLAASISIIAISMTLTQWSPWNRYYQLKLLSQKTNPSFEEKYEVQQWRKAIHQYYKDSE